MRRSCFMCLWLQGLSGDLGVREVLIGELREAAEPLREGCAAEVREKVEAAVNEAVQAWEDTRAELDTLCTKYQHACRLWQQYKDSSAAVKAWVDTQMDSVANLPPEEAVKHIKVRVSLPLLNLPARLLCGILLLLSSSLHILLGREVA